ncbi:MAG: hypothetical protein P8010_04350 [Desulfosarcinaceae bacterium]|jgi:hypothetical protein
MPTSESGSEHLPVTDALFELTAQLELLARNATLETSAHSKIAGGDIVENGSRRLTTLDTLVKEVRETLHWVCTADTQDPAPSEALARLAQRLTQTVAELEIPRLH